MGEITIQLIRDIINLNPDTKLGLMFPFICEYFKNISFFHCEIIKFDDNILIKYKDKWLIELVESDINSVRIRTKMEIFSLLEVYKKIPTDKFLLTVMTYGKEDLI